MSTDLSVKDKVPNPIQKKEYIYISKTGEPEKQLNETINYNEHFSWEWRQGRPGFGPFGKFFKFPEGMSIRMLSFGTHCLVSRHLLFFFFHAACLLF